jgi:hypothetical protein
LHLWGPQKCAHPPGGVFLTVITTSHAPFSMNSRTAGKRYLLTGIRWNTHHTTPPTIAKSIRMKVAKIQPRDIAALKTP